MSRLVSINGTLIDLEYIYKIDIVLPDINSYNKFINVYKEHKKVSEILEI